MVFIIISAVLILLLVIITAAVSFYFYNVAVARNSKEFLSESKDLEQIYSGAQQRSGAQSREWIEGFDYEIWNVTSKDGLLLFAYYLPAKEARKTAILAHGYSSEGRDMEAFARFFRDTLGFNVLMPDARGHGKSEGKYIGFGWHERHDYLLWIQSVIGRSGRDAKIVLFGISMGAATVMSASGEALPPEIKAIIEDCGYSSLWEQLSWQLKRFYRLPSFPFMHATSLITKLRAGYSFREASPVGQVKKCATPTLFIHGADDTFVPACMVKELFDACPAEKQIFIVDGAGHGMAYATDTQGYESKVKAFIGRYVT